MLDLATGATRSWTELNLVGDLADILVGETEIGAPIWIKNTMATRHTA